MPDISIIFRHTDPQGVQYLHFYPEFHIKDSDWIIHRESFRLNHITEKSLDGGNGNNRYKKEFLIILKSWFRYFVECNHRYIGNSHWNATILRRILRWLYMPADCFICKTSEARYLPINKLYFLYIHHQRIGFNTVNL